MARGKRAVAQSFGAQHRRAAMRPGAAIVVRVERHDSGRGYVVVGDSAEGYALRRAERSKARANARAFKTANWLAGREA